MKKRRAGLVPVLLIALSVVSAASWGQSDDRPEALRAHLADAQRRGDEAEVRRLARRAIDSLGDRAGVPEVPDEYRRPPERVRPLSVAEARAGFGRLLGFVREHKWWVVGLDPARTEHLPREVASVITGCLAGVRADAPGREDLLREAREAGDYLLWTQAQGGRGVIPFPAFRGGRNAAFQSAERFLRRAEREGWLDEALRGGWAVDDLDDGGLQFDNGLCGVALLGLFEATGDERYLHGAVAAADWAAGRPVVPNWNYNSFSVDLLANAHRVTGGRRHLEAAKRKFRLGIVAGQLTEGERAGRWADPHTTPAPPTTTSWCGASPRCWRCCRPMTRTDRESSSACGWPCGRATRSSWTGG
ncbi:hypothetical protein [Tautonia plasticadhaerens]|uniref:Uncharacterized protein n=1 Tax=Tautonia plasticadhaerens TaxID=2527974 RepID=A0A518H495_9BACT|nr:hypothetical protein [Tautonia plasticadhaerens]QDV35662.1 hypothetical protein ElP_35660 [Tautonia plasticadhaerens]